MQKDQLDGLLALKLIVEKRSFTAAATALAVTPSAISQSIKQLEGRLGVALLNRTTRSTSLTEAGEQFLDRMGPALDQILGAIEEVGRYGDKPSGLLRLNMPKLIYSSFVAPLIKSYIRTYPDVTVEVFIEDQQSDIVESGFDAGIRLSDILAKDMVALKLFGPVRFVTVGSPKYFDRKGRPKHPKDLLSHDCIRIRMGSSKIYDRWEFEHKGAEFQVQVKGPLILNDSLLVKEAALDGAGIIYTTEDSVMERVRAGQLEIVLSSFAATSTGFYLYYPSRSQVLPKLRTFIDHIKKECKLG